MMDISLKDVSYTYKGNAEPSLKDISMTLDSARMTGLAGANGSGKTTLIRVLLGQLADFTGNYRIDDEEIRDIKGNIPSRFRIGYSPDIPVLDETLTGREILTLVAELRSATKEQFDADMGLFRRELQIDDWLETQQCGAYSTGMRKKTAIAIAFLGPVRYAILDEPLNGLDPLGMAGLRNVARVKREQGVGSLISSHILDFIEKTCDDAILLKHGEVKYAGSMNAMFDTFKGADSLEGIYLGLFQDGTSTRVEG